MASSPQVEIKEPEFTSEFDSYHSQSLSEDNALEVVSDSCGIPVVEDPVFTSDSEALNSGDQDESGHYSALPKNVDSSTSDISVVLAVKTPDFTSDFGQLNSEFDSAIENGDEENEVIEKLNLAENIFSVNERGRAAAEDDLARGESDGASAFAIPAIENPTFSSSSATPTQAESSTHSATSISSSAIPSIRDPVFSSESGLAQDAADSSANHDVPYIHANGSSSDGHVSAQQHLTEGSGPRCGEETYDDEFEEYEVDTEIISISLPGDAVRNDSVTAPDEPSGTSEMLSTSVVGLSQVEPITDLAPQDLSSGLFSPGPSTSTRSSVKSKESDWDADIEIEAYEAAADTMYARLRDAITKSATPRPMNARVKPVPSKRDPALDALCSRLARNTQKYMSSPSPPPGPPTSQLPSKWLHRLRWQNILRTLDEPVFNTPGSPPLSNAGRQQQACEQFLRARTALLSKKTAEEHCRVPPPSGFEMIAEIARGMPRTDTDVWDVFNKKFDSTLTESYSTIV
ncbi:hypothetical protein HDU86_002718 [Geranomyces michiganensis]|nr:hypothetical protein HDU86_002718 [Geranomyces michiganensis]